MDAGNDIDMDSWTVEDTKEWAEKHYCNDVAEKFEDSSACVYIIAA